MQVTGQFKKSCLKMRDVELQSILGSAQTQQLQMKYSLALATAAAYDEELED